LPLLPIADAHVHFWHLEHHRYPWPAQPEGPFGKTAAIRHSYLLDNYFDDSARQNVARMASASNRVRQQSDGSPSTAVARDSGARRHLTYTEGVEAGPQPVDHQVNFGGGDVQRWHEAKH